MTTNEPAATRPDRAPPAAAPPAPGAPDAASTWALVCPAGLFVALTFFVGADMAADVLHGMSPGHLALEFVALLLCLAGAVATGIQLRRAQVRARDLRLHLEGARADLDRARQEAEALRAGLGHALEEQFERWGLTSAQREVALLVLKGLSYKEVAELRATAEHTVRNQALAIFRKAGLAGRAEMAAFFIEDLLVPRDAARQGRPTGEAGRPGGASA